MVFFRYNFVVLKRTVCVQALSILFKNDNSQLTDSKLAQNYALIFLPQYE